ncbi:hypothetical protein [Streptomyces sp. DB-54]
MPDFELIASFAVVDFLRECGDVLGKLFKSSLQKGANLVTAVQEGP